MKEPKEKIEEVSPEVQKKADRTIWLIYAIMIFLILLPFLFLLFL